MAALAMVAVAIGIDVALTTEVGPLISDSGEMSGETTTGEESVALVTADRRELGFPDPWRRYVYTPFTLFENLPNQDLGRVQINSIGLRGPEISPTPDRPRVVVVGGSAAFGRGVPGAGTLSSMLGSISSDYEVLNAGVIGYHTSQELALVVYKLVDLQPSLIIAFNGWNDLFDIYWGERFGDDIFRNAPKMFNDVESRLLKYREIEWNSGYAMYEAGLSIVRNSTLLSALYRPTVYRERKPPKSVSETTKAEDIEWVAQNYVSNMKKMHGVARSNGAKLLVVVQPEAGQLITFAEQQSRARVKERSWPGAHYWSIFPASYLSFRHQVVGALEEAGVDIVDASALMARYRTKTEL